MHFARVLEGYEYMSMIGWDTTEWAILNSTASEIASQTFLANVAGNAMSAFALGPAIISTVSQFRMMSSRASQ